MQTPLVGMWFYAFTIVAMTTCIHMKLVTYLNDYSEKLTCVVNGDKFWAMHNMFQK
jgi:hypothetical protein